MENKQSLRMQIKPESGSNIVSYLMFLIDRYNYTKQDLINAGYGEYLM
jgi:hypothetical protein